MNEGMDESVARGLCMMFSEHFWPIFAIRDKNGVTDGTTDGKVDGPTVGWTNHQRCKDASKNIPAEIK